MQTAAWLDKCKNIGTLGIEKPVPVCQLKGRISMNEELELQIEDMPQKEEEVTTSLCDRFGIHMYSEEFINSENEYNEQQKLQEKEILKAVFNNKKEDDQAKTFLKVMENTEVVIVKKDYTEPTDVRYSGAAIYMIAGMLLAGAFLYIIRRRKKGENYDNDKEYGNK